MSAEYAQAAVIDIGSNSIRLVFFFGNQNFIVPFFNEKAQCALGASVAETGRLGDENIDMALRALRRFRALIEGADIDSVKAIATAAVRDAENGEEFRKRASEALRREVTIIPGDIEAGYGGASVIASVAKPEGYVADLGGGSMDISIIGNNDINPCLSLRIGTLALAGRSDHDLQKAQDICDNDLAKLHVAHHTNEVMLYAIGGSWRALASLCIAVQNYPLEVIHGYTIAKNDLLGIIDDLVTDKLDEEIIRKSVSSSRRELLSFAAIAMKALIHKINAEKVYFISTGVREGIAHELLPPSTDPDQTQIGAFAAFISQRLGRNLEPQFIAQRVDWIADHYYLFRSHDWGISDEMIRAAAELSLSAWWAHPEYRSTVIMDVAALGPNIGVEHHERAFLALVMHHRYEGVKSEFPKALKQYAKLLSDEMTDQARLISVLTRLSVVLAPVNTAPLDMIRLELIEGQLRVHCKIDAADIISPKVTKRLDKVADELGAGITTVIFD